MGNALIYAARSKKAIDFLKRAMRLDPSYPVNYLFHLGLTRFYMEQFEEAPTPLERAHKLNPELEAYPLVVTYAHKGRFVIWVLPYIGLTGGFIPGVLGVEGGVTMLPLLIFVGVSPNEVYAGRQEAILQRRKEKNH
jgi:tetratricopeptide (TPR) repeat protein